MKKLRLKIDEREIEVLAQKISGKLWYHFEGETYSYLPQSNQSQSGAGAVQDPTKIIAPMPGKIIKVLASEGSRVSEGDTVVVMEAMKMEYNLKAAQNMDIKKIFCKEGEQVILGGLLVELEESHV